MKENEGGDVVIDIRKSNRNISSTVNLMHEYKTKAGSVIVATSETENPRAVEDV